MYALLGCNSSLYQVDLYSYCKRDRLDRHGHRRRDTSSRPARRRLALAVADSCADSAAIQMASRMREMKAYNGYTLLDQSVDSINSYSPSPRHPPSSRLCRARIAGRLRHGRVCLRENNTLKTVSGPFARTVCTAVAPHTRAYAFRRTRAERRTRIVSVTRARTRTAPFVGVMMSKRWATSRQKSGARPPWTLPWGNVTAEKTDTVRETRRRRTEPSDTDSAARPRPASVLGRPNYRSVVAR